MYVVHPTGVIRLLMNLMKPALSIKFGRKLRYVNYINEMSENIPVSQLNIPPQVLRLFFSLSHSYHTNATNNFFCVLAAIYNISLML